MTTSPSLPPELLLEIFKLAIPNIITTTPSLWANLIISNPTLPALHSAMSSIESRTGHIPLTLQIRTPAVESATVALLEEAMSAALVGDLIVRYASRFRSLTLDLPARFFDLMLLEDRSGKRVTEGGLFASHHFPLLETLEVKMDRPNPAWSGVFNRHQGGFRRCCLGGSVWANLSVLSLTECVVSADSAYQLLRLCADLQVLTLHDLHVPTDTWRPPMPLSVQQREFDDKSLNITLLHLETFHLQVSNDYYAPFLNILTLPSLKTFHIGSAFRTWLPTPFIDLHERSRFSLTELLINMTWRQCDLKTTLQDNPLVRYLFLGSDHVQAPLVREIAEGRLMPDLHVFWFKTDCWEEFLTLCERRATAPGQCNGAAHGITGMPGASLAMDNTSGTSHWWSESQQQRQLPVSPLLPPLVVRVEMEALWTEEHVLRLRTLLQQAEGRITFETNAFLDCAQCHTGVLDDNDPSYTTTITTTNTLSDHDGIDSYGSGDGGKSDHCPRGHSHRVDHDHRATTTLGTTTTMMAAPCLRLSYPGILLS